MRPRRLLLAFALAAAPGLSLAESPPPEAASLAAFGDAHPDCAEWSDLCQVCIRLGDQTHCSTPGIACTPQAPVCRAPVAKPAPK